jgi:cytochrome c oxidase subunit 2
MSDWYLKRQLQNFRQGLRGAHPQDFNGAQMALMARSLADEQAVNDVVAHIDAL